MSTSITGHNSIIHAACSGVVMRLFEPVCNTYQGLTRLLKATPPQLMEDTLETTHLYPQRRGRSLPRVLLGCELD